MHTTHTHALTLTHSPYIRHQRVCVCVVMALATDTTTTADIVCARLSVRFGPNVWTVTTTSLRNKLSKNHTHTQTQQPQQQQQPQQKMLVNNVNILRRPRSALLARPVNIAARAPALNLQRTDRPPARPTIRNMSHVAPLRMHSPPPFAAPVGRPRTCIRVHARTRALAHWHVK